MDLSEIIEAEELQLKKLNSLVVESIEEEQLLSQRLIELEVDSNLTLGERLADRVASFGGSWTFIIFFFAVLVLWICLNAYYLKANSFDPYPFILLNLVLSCLAALQAPIIMMSQNRQEDKDRRRARSDYMVNMKSEMEIRSLHKKIELLMVEQMQHLFKIQQAQLDILKNLEQQLIVKNTK